MDSLLALWLCGFCPGWGADRRARKAHYQLMLMLMLMLIVLQMTYQRAHTRAHHTPHTHIAIVSYWQYCDHGLIDVCACAGICWPTPSAASVVKDVASSKTTTKAEKQKRKTKKAKKKAKKKTKMKKKGRESG
eukprot:COSAG05_NODE_4267_length_1590_cov_16.591474_2_plen_133_part_00